MRAAARVDPWAARADGSVVLMDSGNYEAYWKSDSEWAPECLHDFLTTDVFDIAFHFDLKIRLGPPRGPSRRFWLGLIATERLLERGPYYRSFTPSSDQLVE